MLRIIFAKNNCYIHQVCHHDGIFFCRRCSAAQKSADYLQKKIGDRKPEVAIILGSGLGSLAEVIQDPIYIPYGEIPGFPKSSVHGHKGRLVIAASYTHLTLPTSEPV